MSEDWQAQGGSAANEAVIEGASAGEMLRAAREAAGLHVAALAVALKVPVRKLEALEADQYDLLTDAVFVRALASSVCRTLKIDSQPVLERLPQVAAPRLEGTNPGINMPFRAPSDGAPPTWLDQLTRPVFLAVFALLLGALVLILLPKTQLDGAVIAATSPASQAPAPDTAQPATSLPGGPDAATAVVSAAAPVGPASAAAAAPNAGAAGPAKAAPSAASAAVSVAANAPAAPASGLIVFRAKGPSWVEVIDANGVVAIRKLLEQGEAAGASGALPLKVTVGRIDTTEVQVRGKPFDLHSISNDNVARFQVK